MFHVLALYKTYAMISDTVLVFFYAALQTDVKLMSVIKLLITNLRAALSNVLRRVALLQCNYDFLVVLERVGLRRVWFIKRLLIK